MKGKIFKDTSTGQHYRIKQHLFAICYVEISSNEFRAKMNARSQQISHEEFADRLATKRYEYVKPKQRLSTIYKNLKLKQHATI